MIDIENDIKEWEVTLSDINGQCECLDFDRNGNLHCGGNTTDLLTDNDTTYIGMPGDTNSDYFMLCTETYVFSPNGRAFKFTY